MFKENYNVIGVMSGTSLDGIDLANIKLTVKNNYWTFKILDSETIAYNQDWLNKLQNAVDFSVTELQVLNDDYTVLLSEIINNFIQKYQLQNLDAVCSHGHTILHQPQNGITLQIGNLPILSKLIHQKVVFNFRIQDVKLGGQGAPLVPIGDSILFSEYDYCLNLGGFSNISFDKNNQRIAFDISPVNTVLNFYANKLGLDYDDKGNISKSGKLNQNLFEKLNALDFYQKKHPKSLGFEFVKETILPLIENFDIDIQDKMNTFSEHIAFQISRIISKKEGKILVTGGGAYNIYLIERMQCYLTDIDIIVPNKKLLEYKEALIFGLLGVLKLRGEINVMRSVTGAIHDHSSGFIYDA